ncbi:MAG: DUF885 domain-containing protein [Gemmatimonadales bacterium]
MRPALLVLCVGAVAVAPIAVAPIAVASQQRPAPEDFARGFAALAAARGRVADSTRLRQLFELHWRYTMTEYPEFATSVGYPGQNHRWTDQSLDAIARRRRELEPPLAVVRAIDRAGLSPADQLNYDLFRRGLEEAVEESSFPNELMPITQLGGVQQDPLRIIALMPARTVPEYEDIVARLEALPRLVDQTLVLLDSGLARGLTPPRVTLRAVPDQVQALLVDDPLASPMLAAFREFLPAVAAAEQARLRQAGVRAFRDRVTPAYRRLHDYLERQYLPRCRETIALSALPNGAAWYAFRARQMTTTNLTPRAIHDLGLAEVKRIRARMDSVIAAAGFRGGFAEFVRFLRTDPAFYYRDSASLVRASRDVAKRADPALAPLFGRLPRLPYGVEPIPDYAAPSQTTAYYEPGSPAAGRAGIYRVNTYNLPARPQWEMEALSLHEAVPGHHLQIALAQELEGLPEFRKHTGPTAFVEGWALYAESLGEAMGFYRDPYTKFGQLTYEMWRAIRLVLDTGIHAFGWTRQQAIDYFGANSAKTEHDIVVEVDRYIVWPGQARAYKIGELKIKELRAFATATLGAGFDVRAFHDEVLGAGALPLDVLDARTRRWVAAVQASSPR